MIYRVIVSLLLVALITCSTLISCGSRAIIPDTDLEAAIRQEINKPEGSISRSYLEALTTLRAFPKSLQPVERGGITDLAGLEYCTNLSLLMLAMQQISDVSPLASLKNLDSLFLDDNQINDISPLASLTNLSTNSWLSLSNNQISDVSPLASLTNLRELHISGNPLHENSINIYIPELEERGVEVTW